MSLSDSVKILIKITKILFVLVLESVDGLEKLDLAFSLNEENLVL